ncbi:MAG: 50S ribosomal protein L11 methyltransferase [candidate division Zixibacteria bacterium]|nr:50S ribosomal protein L11 methyltransferase [candidate division Zixibacteria bacterium]
MKIGRGRYFRLTVTTHPEFEDAISNFLIETGSRGSQFIPNGKLVRVFGYFTASQAETARLKTKKYLAQLGEAANRPTPFKLRISPVRDIDWAKIWRESFREIWIGKKMVIVPGWSRKKYPKAIVVKILPEMAFGTGTHPTTQSCLVALTKSIRPNYKVLDLGTGSGILAIAAVKLGASRVWAIDNDIGIKGNVVKNVRNNRVNDKVILKIGILGRLNLPKSVDLAVANLTGEEILPVLGTIRKHVRKNGHIIISGWLNSDKNRLTNYIHKHKLSIVQSIQRRGWLTLITQK